MTDDESYRAMLMERAERKRQQLREARDRKQRAEIEIDELTRFFQGLNTYLIVEGFDPIAVEDEAPRRSGGLRVPGNRAEGMPPRRTPYADLSQIQAIGAVLTEGEALHADEITRRIYDTRNAEDVRRAKRSLVSTLSQGVAAGYWDRVDKNTYLKKNTERARSNGNQPALSLA